MRWKNWSEFKGQDSMSFSRRRLIENQDTILELTARIQELQNEVNCLNDSRDFKDAESVRSGLSHVPSQPALVTPFRDHDGMRSRSAGMLSRNDKPPDIWDTHGISGNVFVNPTASSSSPYPGGFNPWIANVSEHTSPHVTSERQTPDKALDPRCQSGPSARNSFDPKKGRFSKNYGADQQRLQISDLHFDKFHNPATFACWKIRFKTEECTCSQFLSEALLWIKEVAMVESVNDLKSWCSVRGIRTPNFEVLPGLLQHWTESSRIPASRKRSVWRKWKPKKRTAFSEEDRSLTWSTSTSGSLEPTILSRIMPTYLQLFFEMTIFRNSIRNGTKLSMTQIPSDDILESLHKLRIRESEKRKTVLQLYNMETHQKKAGPDYHRLKTMVKRSIEQILRMKNFEARNGNYETCAVVKNQETKQRQQRSPRDCWQ